MTADESRAAELLTRAGVAGELIPRLTQYAVLVLAKNRRLNLTGAQTVDEMVAHIADTLTITPYVRRPYVDVGSGAGLPGIPIAIATGIQTTLIEATSRKAAFLKEAVVELGLDGITVLARRAEDVGRDPLYREQFGSATARAVAAASAVLELTAPLLAMDGIAVLQRGRMDPKERAALEDAALMLGCSVGAEIPLEGEKRVVLVRKTGATPDRFPRRPGIPEKRPLGQ